MLQGNSFESNWTLGAEGRVYAGERLGAYNFGADHPFGPARLDAFLDRFRETGLDRRCRLVEPAMAQRAPDNRAWRRAGRRDQGRP